MLDGFALIILFFFLFPLIFSDTSIDGVGYPVVKITSFFFFTFVPVLVFGRTNMFLLTFTP